MVDRLRIQRPFRHFVARGVGEVLQSYKDLQDIIASGLDELSPGRRWSSGLQSRSSQPSRRRVYRVAGQYVSVKDTIKGFKMILDGELDEVEENDFYMKGGIDGVIGEDKS